MSLSDFKPVFISFSVYNLIMSVFCWSKKLDIKHSFFLNAFTSGWGIATRVWLSIMLCKS